MPAPKEPMSPWLLRHLQIKTGGFRAARWARCRHCEEIILRGLDGDVAAVTIQADPTPLTPQQEAWCAINGRRTASVEGNNSRKVILWARDPYAIGLPFTQRIVPHHKCGHRYPGFLFPKPAPRTTASIPPF